MNEDALSVDDFEDCVVGIVERFGMEPVLLYDKTKCLRKLEVDGLTPDEAVEYFEFNIIGAWVGSGTPAFATLS